MTAKRKAPAKRKKASATKRPKGQWGTPLYSAPQDAYVYVTIERAGEAPQIKRWKGRSKKSICAAAKKFYGSEAKLRFGNVFYITR